MRSLFRLLTTARTEPKPAAVQRDSIGFVLADGRRIDVLRVRDPRARRIKLSVDERGARLSLPLRASLVAGERFLFEHREWLTAQFAAQAHAGIEPLRRGPRPNFRCAGTGCRCAGNRARVAPGVRRRRRIAVPRARVRRRRRVAALLRDFYEAQGRADVGRWLPAYLAGLPRAPRRIVFKRTSS